jgi:hypothetical protein
MIDESTNTYASVIIRTKGQHLSSSEKAEAREAFNHAIWSIKNAMAPPTPDDIAKALRAMAQMFNVPVPEPTGLALYELALSDLSAPAFKQGCRAVLKVHKWPRLPYPAEIIEHAKIHHELMTVTIERFQRALLYVR